jgi:glycosyltransferase involved in cell wall biosynthesis
MSESKAATRTKKIVLVLPGLGHGGAERVGSQLATAFTNLGHQVLVLAMDSGEEDFFTIEAPTQLVHLGLSAPSQNFAQALRRNWQRAQRLRQVFQEQQPDFIIGFTARVNVLCALASRGLASKVILSERSYPPGMPLGRAWEVLRRWSYSRADVVVAQTQVAAQWLSSNTSAKQVLIIPNGISVDVDTKAQPIAPASLVAPEQKLLLAVGRLVKEKAFLRLVHAMRELSAQYPQWQLVILGEGPLRQELEAASQNLPIYLPGVVGNLSQWYRRADLFALSSSVEGFPNSLLEALDHGCPVVATNCNAGPADLVQYGINGYLVPSTDVELGVDVQVEPKQSELSLITALRTLMSDAALRQQFAANAHQSVQHLEQAQVLSAWQALLAKTS